MDDDLLADDGQFKDDGLDDLDIDAEAALLGMSDEEIEDSQSQNDDQELEYVDEEGNPVSIGENNADLYEVANIEPDKLSNPADEDVLELDLDAELDSFQETSDLLTESPTPSKTFSTERHRKENLISLTSRKEQERPPPRLRKESRYSPEEDHDKSNKDVSFSNQSHAPKIESRDSFGNDLEYDEESEDESIADDHRERFKSERSNIITLTPAKRRTDIPDTLESVISVEETAKVQAFLENEQKRKMRFKGKMQGRMKQPPRFQRPNQIFNVTQGQQPQQLQSSNASSVSQPVSTAPQPRKILINPHFRGIRVPPHTEQGPTINEPSPQPPMPSSSYEMSNFPQPPVQYSHHEPVHPVSMAPPPIYTAPPPAVPYKPPEYPPPQPPMQQIPPTWQQPSEMPIQSYSMPPPQPIVNYGDPVSQPSNYNTYNQSYQNTNYQNMPVPMPQSVNYNQPPPPVHLYTQSYPPQPANPVSSSMTHTQFSPSFTNVRMETSPQQQQYQQTPVSQPQVTSHIQKPRFSQNQQRFSRPPEKRPANTNIKHVPLKQPRLEHPPRKTNVHVNNSNIREIPLVDNLPAVKKTVTAIKTVPIVEEEDEKTKELRMKIEEQKLLREQVLKRKEERRRQMAAQRLMELQKRQTAQNKNTVTIIPKNIIQTNLIQTSSIAKQPVVKPSVKDRIGPLNKNVPVTKKKVVVVRKKIQPGSTLATSTIDSTKQLANVGQKIKLFMPSQKPNTEQTARTFNAVIAKQNVSNKLISVSKPGTTVSPKPAAPMKTESKPQVTSIYQKNQPTNISKKLSLTTQALKIKKLRMGIRPNFQRPQFPPMQRMHRPRIPAPRGAQFPSPHFVESPRMAFRGSLMNDIRMPPMNDIRMQQIDIRMQQMNDIRMSPMNDIRMPPHHFQEPRPPLLPFRHPHGEPGRFNRFFPPELQNNPSFRMCRPVSPNFRPGGMEHRMFHDRFPPPQFRNQIPQMRPMMENNMKRFQSPPRFQHQAKPRFSPNNTINQKPITPSKAPAVKPSTTLPLTANVNQKPNETPAKDGDRKPVSKISLTRNQPKSFPNDKDIPKTQSVSIENLSSSTNEAQLRKLCSSVGVVENIQLLKTERKAVIKFKEPRQALMFQKKYQSWSSKATHFTVKQMQTPQVYFEQITLQNSKLSIKNLQHGGRTQILR